MTSNARDEHDDFDGTTYARVLRFLRTATIKLWSAPLTLRAGLAKGYGQFTVTNDCVRSTAEPTYTRSSLPLAA